MVGSLVRDKDGVSVVDADGEVKDFLSLQRGCIWGYGRLGIDREVHVASVIDFRPPLVLDE